MALQMGGESCKQIVMGRSRHTKQQKIGQCRFLFDVDGGNALIGRESWMANRCLPLNKCSMAWPISPYPTINTRDRFWFMEWDG